MVGMNSEAGAVDWVARAEAIAPVVAAGANSAQASRQVAAEVMEAMHEAELFRIALPRGLGGAETDPMTIIRVVEAVSAADASAGWCLAQGIGCTLAAAFLDPEVAREIYGDPRAVVAWGPNTTPARAVCVAGGYRVTGRWVFASGSRHASWMGGHCHVYDDESTPRLNEAGRPVERTMLFPKAAAKFDDVWDVIGLQGTGSDNYSVTDLFVPQAYTTWRDSVPDRRNAGPLYSTPLITFYGLVFAGVSFGIARATLDEFKQLACRKRTGPDSLLRDNAVIQMGLARAEGQLGSAREYLARMVEAFWQNACAGKPTPLEQRAHLRIAITLGIDNARAAVDFAYHSAGSNAVYASNPFERRFRDMNTLTQQGQAHLSNLEDAGKALLGLNPGYRV